MVVGGGGKLWLVVGGGGKVMAVRGWSHDLAMPITNDKQTWKSDSSLYPVITQDHFQVYLNKKIEEKLVG